MAYTRENWNDLLVAVNDVLENAPEETDCSDTTITPLPSVNENHRWSKADVAAVHAKLLETNCDQISFSAIPDLWSQSILDEINDALTLAWCDCEEEPSLDCASLPAKAVICSFKTEAEAAPEYLDEEVSHLKRWHVRCGPVDEVGLVELPDENGQPSGTFSGFPGAQGFFAGGSGMSPSNELIIFGSESPAQQYYDALVEVVESPCAVVGQPWLSNYPTLYPSIYEYKTCYPIPGGGTECVEEELGGSIRAFKPKYTTSFDAAGCPLS